MKVRLFFCVILALQSGLWAQGNVSAVAQVSAVSRAEVVRQLVEQAHRSPVPEGRKVIWSLTLSANDIYGMEIDGFSAWLDDQGEVWLLDETPIGGLDPGRQVDLLVKAGQDPKSALDPATPMIRPWCWVKASNLHTPHVADLVRAWAEVPPPDASCPAAATAHLGIDVYGHWNVKSTHAPRLYREREYVLRLAEAQSRIYGLPSPSRVEERGIVAGEFEWILGDWIQSMREDLRSTWLNAQSADGYRGLIPDGWISRAGTEMLCWAFSNPNREKFGLAMVARGASLNHCGARGSIPLELACGWGDSTLVSSLLNHGADPTLKDLGGFSALHNAARNDWNGAAVTDLLLHHGADANAADEKGITPLMVATENPSGEMAVQVMRLLLDHGADANAADKKGITPLMMATKNPSGEMAVQVMRLLLGHGADPNHQDEDGSTALHWLAMQEKPSREVANVLVAYGADPDLRAKDGRTATLSCSDDQFKAFLERIQAKAHKGIRHKR